MFCRGSEEVKKMMKKAWTVDERGTETLLERWKFVLDTYQEQPHLIDPHLANILGREPIREIS